MRRISLSFVLLVAATAIGADSWEGQTVMPKKAKLAVSDKIDGRPVVLELKGTSFQILKDQNERVRIRDSDGREGWLDKKELVPCAVVLLEPRPVSPPSAARCKACTS